jgi:type II secretory pathway component PulF
VLATLTTYARSIANLRTTIVDALFYPAIILIFAAILVICYCVFILPRFQQIFRDFNMRLPAITELAFAVGANPINYIVLPVLAILSAALFLRLALGLTERGRMMRARILYALPIVGMLIRSARLSAFAELLGILIDQKTPLPDALRLAGEGSSEPILAAATRRIHADLSQGTPLAVALRGRGLVPEWVSWMVGLGERRGNLGQTLRQVAEMYRRQVETRAALFRTVLPPILLIVTAGLFVPVFVLSMMLPMFKLLEGLAN